MTDAPASQVQELPGIKRPGLVVLGVFGFIAFTAICMAGLFLVYLPFAKEGPIIYVNFPEPRLQASPPTDLAAFEKAQREALITTRWRDEEKGILAIPIDAAMQAIAQKGNAAYDPFRATHAVGSRRPAGAVAPDDRSANPGDGARYPDRVPQ